MSPGLKRFVKTPSGNSLTALLREVAITMGTEIGLHETAASLQEKIDYVLRHWRGVLVIDESFLLYPTRFSKTTAPARLEWVRRSVMDAGVGCVFIDTPQGYNTAKRLYVGKTGYSIEQFEERMLKTVPLAEKLSDDDLLLVARIHFPKLAEDYLWHVIDKVLLAGRSYVSDLEKIAVLARIHSKAAGKQSPGLDQLNAAIADILPSRPRPVLPPAAADAPNASPAKPAQRPGNRIAAPRLSAARLALEAAPRPNFDPLEPEDGPLGVPV